MGVNARFVGPYLVDAPHNQQFVAQRLERFEDSVETFLLQWGRNAQPEKYVECSHGNISRRNSGRRHFFQQRQPDRDATKTLQCRASFHGASSVFVVRTRSLVTMAVITACQVPPSSRASL